MGKHSSVFSFSQLNSSGEGAVRRPRHAPITRPSTSVANQPFDWSNRVSSLPKGSRTRAQRPIAISNGATTGSPPAPKKEPKSLVRIFNDNIGLRAEIQSNDELGVDVRKGETDGFVAAPARTAEASAAYRSAASPVRRRFRPSGTAAGGPGSTSILSSGLTEWT